jgi:hypothetical protein
MDWIDRWVLYWVREPTLWPILLVIVGHVVALVGPLMIWAARDGAPGSVATLVGLAALTGWGLAVEIRARSRPGLLAALLLSTWVLTAVCAWLAARNGLL